MIVATWIKLLDVIVHLSVQTPEARWTKPPKHMSTGQYMALAAPKQQDMNPEAAEAGAIGNSQEGASNMA
jgi:hypothetical protein